MKVTTLRSSIFGLLALGLLASSAVSFAASETGIRPVTAAERQQVAAGMNTEQVTQALGKPAYVKSYARNADTTWVYLTNETPANAEVQIDFGPDGKVKGNNLAWRNGRSGRPY